MTENAKTLYELISKNPTRKFTQREVYEYLKHKGCRISWNETQNQHNDHCRALKDLVDEINFDPACDGFANQTEYIYSLATKEEVDAIVNGYYKRAMTALERYSKTLRKAKRDGQGMIVDNLLREVPHEEPEFHEAFNRVKTYRVFLKETENGIEYERTANVRIPPEVENPREWLESFLPERTSITGLEEI